MGTRRSSQGLPALLTQPVDGRGSEAMGQHRETAVLAGGCFWGMQDLLRRRPGVLSTRVGYTGGDVANPT